MWYNTKAVRILGSQYPILQRPFEGNLSTVQLTAAVSNLGGVGSFGAYTMTPEEIFALDGQLKEATDKPYNINLWVSDTDTTAGNVSAADLQKTRHLFKPYFDALGIDLSDKPLSLALDMAGVDLIIASGFEAGGHRPSFLAPSETSLTCTFVLLQQIKEKVRTPVIAAGGIATGKGIAAALALGADAVQVGTAF